MPAWSGKTRGGVLGYKIFVFNIKYLGLPVTYFFLRFVILYFIVTSPKAVGLTYYYFRRIIKQNIIRSLFAIYRNYIVFGQTLVDKLTVLSGYNKRLSFSFEGEEYLYKMTSEKTGGLLISAHIGSFEIAGYLLKRIDNKVNILMYEAEHEQIKKYLSTIYKDMNTNIICIKEDMSHLFEIIKVFDKKEFLCLHGDRFVSDNKTVIKEFMGYPAKLPSGPFYLAAKFDIPVTYVFAMKEKKYHYHFYATAPKKYYLEKLNVKRREEQINLAMNDYIYAFETILKKYPYQWFNYYRFWEKKEK